MGTDNLSDLANKDTARVHATCVSVEGRAVLILGDSGAGKSGLALELMALGADLVADDRVDLRMQSDQLFADAIPSIRGLIEARGIGLLKATSCGPAPVHYVVDLGQIEERRLPDPQMIKVLRQTVPLLRGDGVPNLAVALIQFMKMGRVDPQWPSK
ncbi:HPr kinase/phosphorylase [Roseibium sp. RKSG952]|uniref:HPr kinase/phosphorylase n=1 Tax=Roseibium sp. RKSG952 TaxID=2529384 RepID=UPI0012BD50EE|nr:HPr kinase/phosphatase C-terminal domain-containing protein [Roseibium sp. RKSG952]MTH98697.1 serine kinase [Roseibium sp. RKSG952]